MEPCPGTSATFCSNELREREVGKSCQSDAQVFYRISRLLKELNVKQNILKGYTGNHKSFVELCGKLEW